MPSNLRKDFLEFKVGHSKPKILKKEKKKDAILIYKVSFLDHWLDSKSA